MVTYRHVAADGTITSGPAALSPAQVEVLQRRGAAFAGFVADAAPIVDDFMRSVLAVDPAPYLADLDRFVEPLDQLVGDVEVAAADRGWLFTRVVYFVGEYLVRRHRGSWQIDAAPGSPTFGHFVVHVPIDRDGLGLISVSPGAVAGAYVDRPPPRRLRAILQELVADIAAARAP
ncbi:MAG: hypothetical protein R3B06_14410 [Kofleriaceae bacterium]